MVIVVALQLLCSVHSVFAWTRTSLRYYWCYIYQILMPNSVLNVKAVVAAFNQAEALVGAFSVIVQLHRLIISTTTPDSACSVCRQVYVDVFYVSVVSRLGSIFLCVYMLAMVAIPHHFLIHNSTTIQVVSII